MHQNCLQILAVLANWTTHLAQSLLLQRVNTRHEWLRQQRDAVRLQFSQGLSLNVAPCIKQLGNVCGARLFGRRGPCHCIYRVHPLIVDGSGLVILEGQFTLEMFRPVTLTRCRIDTRYFSQRLFAVRLSLLTLAQAIISGLGIHPCPFVPFHSVVITGTLSTSSWRCLIEALQRLFVLTSA